ncbi:MAG: hypothetical protein WKF37_23990 [Bryobacteraceae bacterium]
MNRIAKWDGEHWSALDNGVQGCKDLGCTPAVYALALDKNNLYAGGRFSQAGRVNANGIAKWNGSEWAALGDGVGTGDYDGIVWSLCPYREGVYAGGTFITAGGKPARNISKWDGRTWSALSGVGGGLEAVYSIGIRQPDVYVAGDFNTAGGLQASNFARWDGQRWSTAAIQALGSIRALATIDDEIYLGGNAFVLPSGKTTNGAVKWNGENWVALGSGIGNDRLQALVVTMLCDPRKGIVMGGGPFAMSVQDRTTLTKK